MGLNSNRSSAQIQTGDEVIPPQIFKKFCDIVYQQSGITLGSGKQALVSARIGKRIRALKLQNYSDYLDFLIHDNSGEEMIQMLDAISTNVTSFYREGNHFAFLYDLLTEWMEKGQTRFRIWCAASSTGEEPYTLAITINEAAQKSCAGKLEAKILATDISTRVLQFAQRGIYDEKRVEPVSKPLKDRYFETIKDADGELRYKVKPILGNMVTYRRLNLSKPPFPMHGPLDAVFCRNVMIYFDNIIRKGLLDEVYRLLKPGGYLFVGHSESLAGMLGSFKSIQPAIYYKE